jgi:hypothetical protein
MRPSSNDVEIPEKNAAPGILRQDRIWALLVAGLSSLSVLAAMVWGAAFPAHGFPKPNVQSVVKDEEPWPWIRFDARHYRDIALSGYDGLTTSEFSNTVFFPAYPLVVWAMNILTRCPIEWAMLVVSHLCFLGAAALMPDYLAQYTWMGMRERRLWILVYCLWPPSLFFRVGYSESLFLFCYMAFLVAMRATGPRRLFHVGFWGGLASATRVVGIILPAVFWVDALCRRAWREHGLLPLGLCLMLSGWGVVAVCAYQQLTVGDPLAFLHARSSWQLRTSQTPWTEQLRSLVSFEPIWNRDWYKDAATGRFPFGHSCWFCKYHWLDWLSLIACPLCLILCFLVPRVRARGENRVSYQEWLLGLLLWGVAYFGHAYANYGLSFARYSLFVFPVYTVGVWFLCRLPEWVLRGVLVGLLGLLLFFSYGFGAGCAIF